MSLAPIAELFRILARQLRSPRPFDAVVRTDQEAIRHFMQAAHDGKCPQCGSKQWKARKEWHIECRHCGELPMYRGSPLARRRVPARHLLAAVFAVYVDARTHTSRAFHRERALRLDTAWRLLHLVRSTLPIKMPNERGVHMQLLGREAEANAASVVVACCDESLTVVRPSDAVPCDERPRAELALSWGLLRAWMAAHFRGVSKDHVEGYVVEYAWRHGRVERLAA